MDDWVATELISFIKRSSIFNELSNEEIEALFRGMDKQIYGTGEYIIREGDTDQTLKLLLSGRAEIIKEVPLNLPHQIAIVEPGDSFGEMSLLDGTPRSASVRALEPSEVLAFDLQKVGHLKPKILKGLGLKVSSMLRKADQKLVVLLEEKIQNLNLRTQAGNLFIMIILSAAFYLSSKQIYTEMYGVLPPHAVSLFGFGIVVFQAVTGLLIFYKSKFPLESYGLSLKGWPKIVWEAFLVTLPILAIITVIKWVLIVSVPRLHGTPLFEPFAEQEKYLDLYLPFSIIYLLLVPLQEFVVRTCLQSCLRNFFIHRNRILIAIIGSNLLFASEHVVKGIAFAFVVFFMGLFWGFLFEKQKSIIGVIFSHWLVGFWVFFILKEIS